MKTLNIGILLLTILVQQQAHAFLDPGKLMGKLLKLDGEKAALADSKEENFFTVMKDTQKKLFSEIPAAIKGFIQKIENKIEKKVNKFEKEKDELDGSLIKLLEEKKRIKGIFKELIDEKINKIEKDLEGKLDKKDAVVPAPAAYKPLPAKLPAKYVPAASEEVYVAPIVKPKPYVPAPPPLPPAPKKYLPASSEEVAPVVKPKPLPLPPKYLPASSEEAYVAPVIKKKLYKPLPPPPPKYLPVSDESEEPASPEVVYVKPKPKLVPKKYLPASAELPESEEVYPKPNPYAPPLLEAPCSAEYLPETKLVPYAPRRVPGNVYYFT